MNRRNWRLVRLHPVLSDKLLGEEALQLRREAGAKWGIALSLKSLGLVAHYQGNRQRAAMLLDEGFHLLEELGDTRSIAEILEALAGVERAGTLGVPAVQRQQPEDARRSARLLGAAEALRAAMGVPHPPDHPAAYDRNLAAGRAVLGAPTFAAAWAEGRAMPLEQALTYALSTEEPPVAVVPQDRSSGTESSFLSDRERQIVVLLARGFTNARIAAELGIARRTVDTHVSHILSKLGLASRTEVTTWAIQQHVLTLDES